MLLRLKMANGAKRGTRPRGAAPCGLAAFAWLSCAAAPTIAATVQPPAHAESNAVLGSMPTRSSASAVWRLGFASAGDSPPVLFNPSHDACSLGNGAGDGGSQVQAADGGCWVATFPGGEVGAADFGAVCNGSAPGDDRPINAALRAATATKARTVRLPGGVCVVTNAVSIPDLVELSGNAGGTFGRCATTLLWRGPRGGDVVSIAVSTGVLVSPGLTDVCIDGGDSAARGIVKRGVQRGDFQRISITNVTYRGVFEDVADKPSFSDQGSHWNTIQVTIAGKGAAAWEIGASSKDFDVSANLYQNIFLLPAKGAVGFIGGNADGNTFDGLDIYDNGGAASPSFEARAGATSQADSFRENVFFGSTALIDGFKADGGQFASFGNLIVQYKLGDGEPLPQIGPNASLYYVTSYGDGNFNTMTAKGLTVPGAISSSATGGTEIRGSLRAPNLPSAHSNPAGSLCVDDKGDIYVKSSPGPCI